MDILAQTQASWASALAQAVEAAVAPDIYRDLTALRQEDTVLRQARRLAAVYYGALGLAVLPAEYPIWKPDGEVICSCWLGERCVTPGKHPASRHRQDTLLRALPIRNLANLFNLKAVPNIAILTGQRSGGLVVGDADPRHDGSLDALLEAGWPGDTCIEVTGGGGWHVYARWPFDGAVPNLPNYLTGCEVKGDGALVIAAPSVHMARSHYEWLDGHAPWEMEVADLPETVAREILERAPVQMERALTAGGYDVTDPAQHAYGLEQTQDYTIALFSRALDKVDAGEHRNDVALWLGFQLGSLRLTLQEIIALGSAYERTVRGE